MNYNKILAKIAKKTAIISSKNMKNNKNYFKNDKFCIKNP